MSGSEEDEIDPLKSDNPEIRHGYNILNELMSDTLSHYNVPFMDPVDAKISSYSDVIKEPIWMRKMEEKFLEGSYECLAEFVCDFRLMLINCYRYNGIDSRITKVAAHLETLFEQKLMLLSKELRSRCSLAVTLGDGPLPGQKTSTSEIDASSDAVNVSTPRRRAANHRVIFSGGLQDAPPMLTLAKELFSVCDEARPPSQPPSVDGSFTPTSNGVDCELDRRQAELVTRLTALQRRREEARLLEEWPEFESKWMTRRHLLVLRHSPEVVQTVQFLRLAAPILCLPLEELTVSAIEWALVMPRESRLMSNVVNTLFTRSSSRQAMMKKPPLYYRQWEQKVRQRVSYWYRLSANSVAAAAAAAALVGHIPQGSSANQRLGDEPRVDAWEKVPAATRKHGVDVEFFRVMGWRNPLEIRRFHELSLYQRICVLKALIDSSLWSQESLTVALDTANIDWTATRETVLGKHGDWTFICWRAALDSEGKNRVYRLRDPKLPPPQLRTTEDILKEEGLMENGDVSKEANNNVIDDMKMNEDVEDGENNTEKDEKSQECEKANNGTTNGTSDEVKCESKDIVEEKDEIKQMENEHEGEIMQNITYVKTETDSEVNLETKAMEVSNPEITQAGKIKVEAKESKCDEEDTENVMDIEEKEKENMEVGQVGMLETKGCGKDKKEFNELKSNGEDHQAQEKGMPEMDDGEMDSSVEGELQIELAEPEGRDEDKISTKKGRCNSSNENEVSMKDSVEESEKDEEKVINEEIRNCAEENGAEVKAMRSNLDQEESENHVDDNANGKTISEVNNIDCDKEKQIKEDILKAEGDVNEEISPKKTTSISPLNSDDVIVIEDDEEEVEEEEEKVEKKNLNEDLDDTAKTSDSRSLAEEDEVDEDEDGVDVDGDDESDSQSIFEAIYAPDVSGPNPLLFQLAASSTDELEQLIDELNQELVKITPPKTEPPIGVSGRTRGKKKAKTKAPPPQVNEDLEERKKELSQLIEALDKLKEEWNEASSAVNDVLRFTKLRIRRDVLSYDEKVDNASVVSGPVNGDSKTSGPSTVCSQLVRFDSGDECESGRNTAAPTPGGGSEEDASVSRVSSGQISPLHDEDDDEYKNSCQQRQETTISGVSTRRKKYALVDFQSARRERGAAKRKAREAAAATPPPKRPHEEVAGKIPIPPQRHHYPRVVSAPSAIRPVHPTPPVAAHPTVIPASAIPVATSTIPVSASTIPIAASTIPVAASTIPVAANATPVAASATPVAASSAMGPAPVVLIVQSPVAPLMQQPTFLLLPSAAAPPPPTNYTLVPANAPLVAASSHTYPSSTACVTITTNKDGLPAPPTPAQTVCTDAAGGRKNIQAKPTAYVSPQMQPPPVIGHPIAPTPPTPGKVTLFEVSGQLFDKDAKPVKVENGVVCPLPTGSVDEGLMRTAAAMIRDEENRRNSSQQSMEVSSTVPANSDLHSNTTAVVESSDSTVT